MGRKPKVELTEEQIAERTKQRELSKQMERLNLLVTIGPDFETSEWDAMRRLTYDDLMYVMASVLRKNRELDYRVKELEEKIDRGLEISFKSQSNY